MRTCQKQCCCCKKRKSIKKFPFGLEGGSRKTWKCAACYARERRAVNPTETQRQNSDRALLKNHGITRDEWQAILERQGNVCGICGKNEWRGAHGRPHVDHDHETGCIRGILCDRCNRGLGFFDDDTELLNRALIYLRIHK